MSLTSELRKVAEADFPSRFGQFRIYGFAYATGGEIEEVVALKMGDLEHGGPPLVRIHSQCLTGDVFHSLRCDCRAQLELALETIALEGRGLLVYENQEGRGIGLLNKLRAYNLQDLGYDTVDANLILGHQADERDYTVAALILQDWGVRSINLMTNNPDKIERLRQLGVQVTARVPLQADVTPDNASYLRTKVERMNHLLMLGS